MLKVVDRQAFSKLLVLRCYSRFLDEIWPGPIHFNIDYVVNAVVVSRMSEQLQRRSEIMKVADFRWFSCSQVFVSRI